MPEIQIPAAYSRDSGDFPEFRMENMFWEETPTTEKGVAIISRPPLIPDNTVGSGPIYGAFHRDDIFNGDEFIISGSNWYRVTGGVPSLLSSITGNGPVRWAHSDTEIVVTRGDSAYSYNGTNVQAVLVDGMNVRSVTYLNTYFIYVPISTAPIKPGRYYFSAPNDGRTVNALDYINAESLPDRLIDVLAVGDNLYLAGSDNIEVATTTANPDAPFGRIQQRSYDIGVTAPGLMVKMDNAVHVLADDDMIYRLGQIPERISTHFIEEKVQQSASHGLFSFKWQGHNFLAVRLDSGVWLKDIATQQWTKFSTNGRDRWAAQCSYEDDATPRFGDDTNGTIWRFGEYSATDSGQQTFRRIFPAVLPISGGSAPVYNIIVEHNAGATPITSGSGSDPVLGMSYSRDAGRNWSASRTTRMGVQGETRRVARFGSCGQFDDPGAMFEFTLSNLGPLRVSKVRINDSMAGRSRS